MEKWDPKKQRKGILKLTETVSEKILTKIKNLVYSRVGCKQPTSSGA